jgi:hypothetical protein
MFDLRAKVDEGIEDVMKLIAVEWIDSSGANGWNRVSETPQAPERIRSIGWVIAESDESITIAPHMTTDQDDQNCMGALTIPKACIQRRKAVKWPWSRD